MSAATTGRHGQPPVEDDDADPADKRLGDAANPRKVEEAQKKGVDREQRRLDGLKQVLGNPNARLWLWDLLERCGTTRTSFTGNSGTFFKEGERNIGLQILADLTKHYPDQYITMLKEGNR